MKIVSANSRWWRRWLRYAERQHYDRIDTKVPLKYACFDYWRWWRYFAYDGMPTSTRIGMQLTVHWFISISNIIDGADCNCKHAILLLIWSNSSNKLKRIWNYYLQIWWIAQLACNYCCIGVFWLSVRWRSRLQWIRISLLISSTYLSTHECQ